MWVKRRSIQADRVSSNGAIWWGLDKRLMPRLSPGEFSISHAVTEES